MHLHIYILRSGEDAGAFFSGSMPYCLETRCLTESSAAHHVGQAGSQHLLISALPARRWLHLQAPADIAM